MTTFAYFMLGWMGTSLVAGFLWAVYRAWKPRSFPAYENEMLGPDWENKR